MKSTLLVSVSLLALSIGAAIRGTLQPPARQFTGTLREILPPAPLDWTMHQQVIADTPEMKEAVNELLNFDDAVYVDYIGPNQERLSVYIAYWTPGKMSHRLIASHIPDICWIGNGWKKIEDTNTSQFLPNLPVGEARVFSTGSKLEYVWYWHIVGGDSIRYISGQAPPWHAFISDMAKKGLNQRQEQIFIRISSERPISNFLNTPILPQLIHSIPWPKPRLPQ